MKIITIDGIEYIPKSECKTQTLKLAKPKANKPYVIIRTYSAGVFAGYLDKVQSKEVKLLNARRLWKWDGAASLSQLAVDGVSKPKNCKFPTEVPEIVLTEAIEIIKCTEKARLSIASVEVWTE